MHEVSKGASLLWIDLNIELTSNVDNLRDRRHGRNLDTMSWTLWVFGDSINLIELVQALTDLDEVAHRALLRVGWEEPEERHSLDPGPGRLRDTS